MSTIYSFGSYVRRRRKALDMTQRELAEVVGCALVTLKKIETDRRRPSPEMAARLAECLAVPEAEHLAFMAAARGAGQVDNLAPPRPTALFPPHDVVPTAPTQLIGREAEIATTLALLSLSDVRLATLVGPGGIGKTRLALAAAAALQQTRPRLFGEGIVFVDLAATSDAGKLTPAMAAALGFELDTGGRDPRPPFDQLAAFLKTRNTLLILDNLEQIAGARHVIDNLLRSTTNLKILATSRERLDLPWEHLVSLPGLAYPTGTAADPAEFPAGRLFLARARRIRPNYSPDPADRRGLAELCALVDGMPLALELAASWIDTLSLAEIAGELHHDLGFPVGSDDLPQRHSSLRAVWDSAWERLDAPEQAAFAQLCVFRGGFTRAAAESVAGVTLGLLGRLTAKYLITLDRKAGRYRVHEMLRQYGFANLEALGAGETLTRRFNYFSRFVADQALRIHGPEQPDALRRIAAETDNLAAALEWGLSTPGEGERTAQMMDDLHWYWRIRSHVAEASAWLDRALALPGLSAVAEAQLLYGAGHFAWMRGDFFLARDRHTAVLARWQAAAAADSLAAAVTTLHLAMSYSNLEDQPGAAPLFAAALARFRELGATWYETFSLSLVAKNRQALGDGDGAARAAAEHLRLVAQLGDPWLTGLGRLLLGELALDAGDLAGARRLLEEGLAAQRVTGHSHSVGAALTMLGEIARQVGDRAAALEYYGEAAALYETMGFAGFAAETREIIRLL